MIDIAALPGEVIDHMAALRKEASKYRHQRNGARREAEQLRQQVAELKARLAKAEQRVK